MTVSTAAAKPAPAAPSGKARRSRPALARERKQPNIAFMIERIDDETSSRSPGSSLSRLSPERHISRSESAAIATLAGSPWQGGPNLREPSSASRNAAATRALRAEVDPDSAQESASKQVVRAAGLVQSGRERL
ncbi:hypothetical protein [Methylobacterium nodulans]|uniref:hypothetical protein n=1 Tax=Methylobacterium nodulans TaxID=114616 RepID=UPI0012ED08D0|nr:hypothetical protein [Methylobacterium nodulans]